MGTHYYIVLTRANPGQEAEFDDWYDQRHLSDLVKVPGVVQADRYKIAHMEMSSSDMPSWTSVAIYTIEAEDPQVVLAEITARSSTEAMFISSALDLSSVAQLMTSRICSVSAEGREGQS